MGNLFCYPLSRIIQTVQGQIQGRRLIYKGEKQVDAFQGIPFAAPPIGELRFKKPAPHEKWEGVRATNKFGPRSIAAPFLNRIIDCILFMRGIPSEDCLTLNVFTPCWKAPKDGFPVMVFVHGGAFELGDAKTHGDVNICENIVTHGVIFVTIQYRVGYLGFMTTGDSACPGNLGLWDQIAALQWVNDNIAAFGGNRGNITLIGQSAGAASVDMLHLSPHSTNLFHKIIPMSGSAECRWATNQYMPEQCIDKARRLGINEWKSSEEFLEKLRSVPARKFGVDFIKQIKQPEADLETVPFIDGNFFPASLDELRKRATPKPMLTGVVKEEGLLFIAGKRETEKDLNEVIREVSQGTRDKDEIAADLRALYIDKDDLLNKRRMLRKIANMASDCGINAAVLEMCRKTVQVQEEPVFLYLFEQFNPTALGLLGRFLPLKDTTHGGETYYLFGKGIFSNVNATEDDKLVRNQFTTAFTNFAKFGNPNGADEGRSDLPVYWRPLDKLNHSRNFVFVAHNNQMNEEFFGGRPAKFVEIINKHRT